MSGTQAATVQTLTAEVRTLVVGARQVTLSVAKQLDVVPLAELRVFGRVKIPAMTDIAAIGAAEDGTLALARWERVPDLFVPAISQDVASVVVCRGLPRVVVGFTYGYRLSLAADEFAVPYEDAQGCDSWYHSRPDAAGHSDRSCDPQWHSDGQDDAIRAEIATQRTDWTPRAARNAAAKAAPLIVLAGLR
jgi:hypothetical protein